MAAPDLTPPETTAEATRVLCAAFAECLHSCAVAETAEPGSPIHREARAALTDLLALVDVAARSLTQLRRLGQDADCPGLRVALDEVDRLIAVGHPDPEHVQAVERALVALAGAIGVTSDFRPGWFAAAVTASERAR